MSIISCIAVCVALRALLFVLFPQLPTLVDGSVQFSTPVTSSQTLKEGIFLLKHYGSRGLYKGGVVHLPPMLLQLAGLWSNIFGESCLPVLFVALDTLIVGMLYKLQRNGSKHISAWLYCVSPLTVLSCLGQSTVVFTHAALIMSLYFIVINENISLSALSMTIATYLDPSMAVMTLPLLNYHLQDVKKPLHKLIKSGLFFAVTLVSFFGLYLIQPFPVWDLYKTRLTFASVTPNMGLWWYFFIEMFQEFIPFFKSVFMLFSQGMIIPMTVRFHSQSLPIWILCFGWLVLTKSYPTLGETGLFLTLLPFMNNDTVHLLKYMKWPGFTTLLFLHGVLLSPIFHHLWIDLGSGNANFFYAISLVYNLALGLLITDVTWGVVHWEYDRDQYAGKPDYKKKLTQV